MVSQTKNKLDLFQKCRFEKMDFPKFEKQLRGDVRLRNRIVQLTASQVAGRRTACFAWAFVRTPWRAGVVELCLSMCATASCVVRVGEWVSWCRFISVGAVCHGSCILHRQDNRPHTVQAECLRPTCILGLLAVCSLRADKQAQFATRRLFISLRNMPLEAVNSRQTVNWTIRFRVPHVPSELFSNFGKSIFSKRHFWKRSNLFLVWDTMV